MVSEGVVGVRLPVEEGVGGVEERVEGVYLSVGEGAVGYLLVFFSFSLFMYVSYDFLLRSYLLGSFVIFCDVLSMFILRYKRKGLKQTWIQFLNILFLIQPGKK